MTQFKVPRIIPLEYSALDGLHCMGVPDTKILKALQEQRDDTFKDTLRQVSEMLDGIENPYPEKRTSRATVDLEGHCDYMARLHIGFDEAIQTIKQAIGEGK